MSYTFINLTPKSDRHRKLWQLITEKYKNSSLRQPKTIKTDSFRCSVQTDVRLFIIHYLQIILLLGFNLILFFFFSLEACSKPESMSISKIILPLAIDFDYSLQPTLYYSELLIFIFSLILGISLK